MADEQFRVSIPAVDDAAFQRSTRRIFQTFDRLDRRARETDRVIRGIGAFGGGRRDGATARGRGARPSGGGGRRGGGGFGGAALGQIAGSAGVTGGGRSALSAGLGLGSILAFTAALKSSITLAAQFEAQLGEIGRVANFSAEELGEFGEVVADLSAEFPVGTDQINKLASAGANAGLRARDLGTFTREMTKLAAILPSISDEEVRGILRIGNLTGFPIARIGELNGALVKLQQNSKATLPQLIKISQRVAQDAGIFGLTAEEVTGLAATIADLGLQPERASTALGKLVGQLKNINSLGAGTVEEIVGTFRTPIDPEFFRELASADPIKALELLGKESVDFRKNLASLQVTGKQAIISENVLRNIDRFQQLLAVADPDKGIINQQDAERAKEVSAQIKILTNQIKNDLRDFGKIINSSITLPLLQGVSSFAAELKLAVGGLVAGDLDESVDVGIDRLQQFDSDIANSAAVAFGNTARAVRDLRAEGLKLQDLDLGATIIAPDIQVLDERQAKLLDDLDKRLRNLGLTAPEVSKELAKLSVNVSDFLRFDEALKRSNDSAARLAARLGDINDALAKTTEKTLEAEIALGEVDLTNFEKAIGRSAREAFKSAGENLLTETQISDFRDRIEGLVTDLSVVTPIEGLDLGLGLEPFLNSLDELLKEDSLAKGIRDSLGEVRTLATLLDSNNRISDNINRRQDLQNERAFRLEAKNIAERQKQIAAQQAPGLAAITDTGSAIEQINQLQNTNDLVQEQLKVGQDQLKVLEQQLKQQKKRVVKVAPAPT